MSDISPKLIPIAETDFDIEQGKPVHFQKKNGRDTKCLNVFVKKELADMSQEKIAEFVGFSRNGKWVIY